MYSISLSRNLVVLRARVVFTIFALKVALTVTQHSLSRLNNNSQQKIRTHLARLKASSIIWARLITGMSWKLAIEIEFGVYSFGNTTEIMQHYFQQEELYLMFGAQFVEETFPVLWVIVDSVETLHIYVGHQPVVSTKCHFCICSCLDSDLKNKHSFYCVHHPCSALNIHLK